MTMFPRRLRGKKSISYLLSRSAHLLASVTQRFVLLLNSLFCLLNVKSKYCVRKGLHCIYCQYVDSWCRRSQLWISNWITQPISGKDIGSERKEMGSAFAVPKIGKPLTPTAPTATENRLSFITLMPGTSWVAVYLLPNQSHWCYYPYLYTRFWIIQNGLAIMANNFGNFFGIAS